MKTFKDLIIQNQNPSELKEFLQIVISKLPASWKLRDDLILDYSKNVSKSKEEIGCFESSIIDGKIGLVWLVLWEKELKVVNIVPSISGSLSHDEYNKILDTFYNECILKVNQVKNFKIEVSEGNYDIKKIAGGGTFEALYKWEACCNHSTGNTHPNDFERWAEFVCTAHRKNQI